jgi:hypothetical protein
MPATPRLPRLLRALALGSALAGVGVWLATGAHAGWTQTSVVTMQRDEITGIDFPVRRSALIAGVEVPVTGVVLATLLLGASFLRRGRPAESR